MNKPIDNEDIIGGQDLLAAALPIGRVVSVSGACAIIQLKNEVVPAPTTSNRPEVGTILKIKVPNGEAVGILSGLSIPVPASDADATEIKIAELQLLGEFRYQEDGTPGKFRRGVTGYPSLGDGVFETNK